MTPPTASLPASTLRWLRPLLASLFAVLTSACTSLPPAAPRTPSLALTDTADTRLGRAAEALRAPDPTLSTFTPLARGSDALVARMGLIEHAERSIDLQYYIWHRDDSGIRLSQRLKAAAARGVRVRVLLDDIGTNLPDAQLLALDAHPNIEVRLFNPVAWRITRNLGAVLDFARVNRRMHNKLMLADNQVVILGGRNIGNEYFEAHAEADFGDLDVLAVGPVVRAASDDFDLYWNSPQVWPVNELTEPTNTTASVSPDSSQLPDAPADDAELIRALLGSKAKFFQAPATLLVDHPSKITRSPSDTTGHLWPQLVPVIARTQQELLLISPYFVPGENGVRFLSDMQARGVKITILTNSLAATDVSLVHSGYARYREALLAAGIALWEVKPHKAPESPKESPKETPEGTPLRKALIGSTLRSSLHAKTYIFDQRELFIGSLNLDPRSTSLNTENGVLIGSADFAERMSRNVHKLLPASAYRLSLENGDLRWHEQLADGSKRIYDNEPETTALRRIIIKMLGWLPIEEQL